MRGAWVIARNVRNDLWRRETMRRDLKWKDRKLPYTSTDGEIEARWTLRHLAQKCPKQVTFLIRYAEERRHAKKDIVKAHRYRGQLRRALG